MITAAIRARKESDREWGDFFERIRGRLAEEGPMLFTSVTFRMEKKIPTGTLVLSQEFSGEMIYQFKSDEGIIPRLLEFFEGELEAATLHLKTRKVVKCSEVNCNQPAVWKAGTWWLCDIHVKDHGISAKGFDTGYGYTDFGTASRTGYSDGIGYFLDGPPEGILIEVADL